MAGKPDGPAAAVILIVDDDAESCELIALALRAAGFDSVTAASGEEGLATLRGRCIDAIVTDVHMGGMDGIELCRRVHEIEADLPIVVVTGQSCVDTAVAALRVGAYDFLAKPIDVKLLIPTVRRAAERRMLGTEVKHLRQALQHADSFGALIGSSEVMRRVFEFISRIADAEVPVLVTGETGTGKELVARAVHERSRRLERPFVAINCAAIPASLLESGLFGHVKGAFTDAKSDRDGLFVQADGGTLFLDEVGELPLELQPKLLRALQEGVVRPVGGEHEVAFDARLITATNRNLEAEVKAGRFREDLFYRIDVVRVDLPPLRHRGRDVLLLAQAFIDRLATRTRRALAGVDAVVAERLLAYPWPGNVRELENCIERAVALAVNDQIVLADLPKKLREHRAHPPLPVGSDAATMPTLEEFEGRYIASVLKASGDNKTQAANILGIDRRTLYRRMERHGLSEDDGEGEPRAGRKSQA